MTEENDPSIKSLVEASSLGDDEAVAARQSVDPALVARTVARARELRERKTYRVLFYSGGSDTVRADGYQWNLTFQNSDREGIHYTNVRSIQDVVEDDPDKVHPSIQCMEGDHDWTDRGTRGDLWRECYFCGRVEDRQAPAACKRHDWMGSVRSNVQWCSVCGVERER